MELLYVLPGAGMPLDELKRRADTANRISRAGTNVSVVEVGEGPISIESAVEDFMSVGPMLRFLYELDAQENYDAVIVGCAGDPGLAAVRELLDVPVIGPGESSFHYACMVSDRFSIVSILSAGVASEDGARAHLRGFGLESRLASVEFVESSVEDMWSSDDQSILGQVEVCVERAKSGGAGCVVLGCMSMAFHLLDEKLSGASIPIVNPLKTAIKAAEAFVDMRLRHSRVTYPRADLLKLERTVFSDE
ncbi:hypothetical protein EU546_02810 [Candidatus Thorarchaeota archaeon]|nr:MAG: hypothetical protein EU546_02810 [Candidatus Thorarchaeota archaeon]